MTDAPFHRTGIAGRLAVTAATAVLVAHVWAALPSAASARYRLYNVVPLYVGHEAEQAARCVEMYERTGEDLTGVAAERKDLLFNADYDRVAKCSMSFTPAADGSVLYRAAEGAERLSGLVYYPYSGAKDFETVAPATVFYRNRLGGETVTVSYHGALGFYETAVLRYGDGWAK